MAIREDIVASAAQFLQDPSVASSPPDSRVAFLKAKNLTPEEIAAALSRAGLEGAVPSAPAGSAPTQQAPPHPQQPPVSQPAYYGSPYGQSQAYPPPPYGWQPSPHEPPRRDWRDWFIMATVVGGMGYGIYELTKRYVYPLIAPPTPDHLEQDKKEISAQFDRAFSLVEKLAKDTEALKAAEQERSDRVDASLSLLETALTNFKANGKRRQDDAERLRDDVRDIKDALPKALDAQREITDNRLREVNAELKGLRTLIGQRMGGSTSSISGINAAGTASNAYPRSSLPAPAASAPTPAAAATPPVTKTVLGASQESDKTAASTTSTTPALPAANNGFVNGYSAANLAATANNTGNATTTSSDSTPAPQPALVSSIGKASIPAWQRAMLKPAAAAAPSSETKDKIGNAGAGEQQAGSTA